MPKLLSTLFRSARTSCSSSGGPINPSVRPYARKIWITYIKAYMPYESSESSSNQPDFPMGSPRRPFDTLGPPTPPQPIDPLGHLNSSLGLIVLYS